MTNRSSILATTWVLTAAMSLSSGCIKRHPRSRPPAPLPDVPATDPVMPTTAPVATQDLGTVDTVPGLARKPKPFIALPKRVKLGAVQPSTLLAQHASVDSPIPLSEYPDQPVHAIADFHLRAELSADELKRRFGDPAQIAGNDDPWYVYRLGENGELWLYFAGSDKSRLVAADVIRGVEDGYSRQRVFDAQ